MENSNSGYGLRQHTQAGGGTEGAEDPESRRGREPHRLPPAGGLGIKARGTQRVWSRGEEEVQQQDFPETVPCIPKISLKDNYDPATTPARVAQLKETESRMVVA